MTITDIAEHMRLTLVPSEETLAAATALLEAGHAGVYSVAGISSATNPEPSMLWMGDEIVIDMGVVSSHSADGEQRGARGVAYDRCAAIATETAGAAYFHFTLVDGAPHWAAWMY